jgi:hypothetical protein
MPIIGAISSKSSTDVTVIVWLITVSRMYGGIESVKDTDKRIHPTMWGTGYSS